jgi:hypothetical protein
MAKEPTQDDGIRIQLTPANAAKILPLTQLLNKSVTVIVNEIIASVQLVEVKSSIVTKPSSEIQSNPPKTSRVRIPRLTTYNVRG